MEKREEVSRDLNALKRIHVLSLFISVGGEMLSAMTKYPDPLERIKRYGGKCLQHVSQIMA